MQNLCIYADTDLNEYVELCGKCKLMRNSACLCRIPHPKLHFYVCTHTCKLTQCIKTSQYKVVQTLLQTLALLSSLNFKTEFAQGYY